MKYDAHCGGGVRYRNENVGGFWRKYKFKLIFRFLQGSLVILGGIFTLIQTKMWMLKVLKERRLIMSKLLFLNYASAKAMIASTL